ncbi:MAG: M23 family peptidase, partial [Pseudomonadota bacterium]
MERVNQTRLSKFDEASLNRGLFTCTALALVCMAGAAIGGWFASPVTNAQLASLPTAAEADPVPMLDPITDFRAIAPAIETVSQTGTLKRRSTLIETLIQLGADPNEANQALEALYEKALINPRRVRAGLRIKADFETETGRLSAITLRPEAETGLISKRQHDGSFFAAGLNIALTPVTRRIMSTIETSIYDAALKAGAADQQVADFAQIFGYDIDFQREVYVGDSFEIVYEAMVDERGHPIRSGEVLYAAIHGHAMTRGYYRHTPEDRTEADYFT